MAFEAIVSKCANVELIRQAQGYFQVRITQQYADFSIDFDQSCYAALLLCQYLPMSFIDSASVTNKTQYAATLRSDFNATKTDGSKNNIAMKEIETGFRFKPSRPHWIPHLLDKLFWFI
jgi:hypothetical protein